MKKLCFVFSAISVLLFAAMCAVIALYYSDMLWAGEHLGYSAPAYIAFLWAIPFGIGIAVFAALAVVVYKKFVKKDS